MQRLLIALVLVLSGVACGSDPAPAPSPPVPSCQANSTATVYFQNRSVTNRTYDVIWDGSRLTTIAPGQDSAIFPFAAATHSLWFQFTNTSVLACNPSSPVLAVCSNVFFGCGG